MGPHVSVQAAFVASLGALASAKLQRTNGPQMGWNTYNGYNCNPSESIIKTNAQALIEKGADKLGYIFVTPDCGWMNPNRDSSQRLVWNPTKFPSGGKALGDWLHSKGLKFGLYSGAGYYQCGNTNPNLPASLGFEKVDAQSFSDWGADSLKYDNCYSDDKTNMANYNGAVSVNPARFRTMADALNATSRPIVYQICQWGVGENIRQFAELGNSYRMSNDIQNNWKSIWRIANQIPPLVKWIKPGAYADMDMLTVGLNALSTEEEKFHFGLWAIEKSPLIIGAAMATIPQTSLDILMNKEIIALNQDPLGAAAALVRRYSQEQYDVWAGPLSGDRMVLAVSNWNTMSTSVTVNLASVVNVISADARDVWAKADTKLNGTYTATIAGHQLKILVLSNIVKSTTAEKSVGYYLATAAQLSGSAKTQSCLPSQCLPGNRKVAMGNSGRVTFNSVSGGASGGKKVVGVDFIQYDVALGSAWADGASVRPMAVQVNGGTTKNWQWPIAGGNWYETGRLNIELEGLRAGTNNTVVFSTTAAGPDLVGFEVFELA